jgi:CheY-like chemotaxis protein
MATTSVPNDAVLVVDDDAATRDFLLDLLEGEGFLPVAAANGDEALEALRIAIPRFITLDLVMPRKTGWEVLEALRENPAWAGIPVFVIATASTREAGVNLDDIAGYFQKPLDVVGFLRAVKKCPGLQRR